MGAKYSTKVDIYQKIKVKLGNCQSYLIITLFVILSLSLARNILRINEAKKRVAKIKEKIEKLDEENKQLEVQLKEVQKSEFVEKQLRDKLGLVKEGETVIVLPDEDTLRRLIPPIQEEDDVLPDPTWRKWLHLFDF